MAKYSTDPDDDDPDDINRTNYQNIKKFSIDEWIHEALEQAKERSDNNPKETFREILEYTVVEWHKTIEKGDDSIVPGERIQYPEFRCDIQCLECKSDNEFLFREIYSENNTSILCLSCDNEMSREEATRITRANEIQDMDRYTIEEEGDEYEQQYDGDFRTPMRFKCEECRKKNLTLPDPSKVNELICPNCFNKGKVVQQMLEGPTVNGFDKYHKDEYGRDVSKGLYDGLEDAYKDGHER